MSNGENETPTIKMKREDILKALAAVPCPACRSCMLCGGCHTVSGEQLDEAGEVGQ